MITTPIVFANFIKVQESTYKSILGSISLLKAIRLSAVCIHYYSVYAARTMTFPAIFFAIIGLVLSMIMATSQVNFY